VATGLGVRGLGSDLVDIARFRLALERRASLPERLFSDAERTYTDGLGDPVKSLAARFGAKEAVMKAMGVGLWQFAFRDVEVLRLESGAPRVVLHQKAAELAAERGIVDWQLTLSHTDTTAMAVAIALG
jgi:holo-[acyl-carrier protein] synthase